MPRELTGTERREAIITSSMKLFASRGFAGTTTRELALAAGISEAMVYKHFPDKESLYDAILQRKIGEAEKNLSLSELSESDEPPNVFFGRIAATMFERVESDPTFLKLFLYSALEGHPLAAAFDRARGSALREVIRRYVRRETKRGRMRDVDPAFAARTFVGMVAWFSIARMVLREPGALRISRERLVRDIVSHFLDGVRGGGKRS